LIDLVLIRKCLILTITFHRNTTTNILNPNNTVFYNKALVHSTKKKVFVKRNFTENLGCYPVVHSGVLDDLPF